MKEAQNAKYVLLTPPQLKDDGDLASNTYVDTSGWGYVEFIIATGTVDAALGSTAEGNAVKIEECDTTGGSYTDVTDAALADAIADDEDDSLFKIDVDLVDKTHKRYMQVNAPHAGDGANGVNAAIIARLSKPLQGPTTATERGLVENIIA